jgi:hypothetical protein
MMIKRQGLRAKLKSHQQGAVAIIVALSFVALVGMLGLVLDLGHLYINKTGLQNAADAASLSGAERLDGTLCRVNSILPGCDTTQKGAVQYAIETAGRNNYGFNNIPVDIDIGDIYIGSCPDRDRPGAADTDGCLMLAAASIDTPAEAAGLGFVQVDTRDRTLNTWFARIWSILQTQTYAMAVAGRYVTEIAPLAVCALDASNPERYVSADGSWPKYLVEYGFSRGTAYELDSINNIAGLPSGFSPGSQLYLHPTAKTESECDSPNNENMMPYICGGKSTFDGAIGAAVYANTGVQADKSVDAFNTRFGASSAYCTTVADSDQTLFTPSYAAASWMNYTIDDKPPTQSVINDLAWWLSDPSPFNASIYKTKEDVGAETGGCGKDATDNCGDNFGVLWSNYRPLKRISATADPEPAVPADWPSLYGGLPAGAPSYVGTTPWVPKYTGNGRRIINVIIANCGEIVGAGSCAKIPVLGVGEFLLQTKVTSGGPGGGTNVYGEFGRVIPVPLSSALQIRLYR